MHANGVDRTRGFAGAAADTPAGVDPQPIIVERIAEVAYYRLVPCYAAVGILAEAGDFDDAALDRHHPQAFVAQHAGAVDDLEFVIAQIAARGFGLCLRGVVAKFDFAMQ